MTIEFTVPGEPVGKGRPRFNRATGRAYTPDRTARYENLVKLEFERAYPGWRPYPRDTPLVVEIDACYTPPASASKKNREAMLNGKIKYTKKSDIDNICKAILDGLHGVCFEDDSCVVRIIAEKRYAPVAQVSVLVGRADGANSPK